MLIERLKLNDFRNYESLLLRPDSGLNVIVGENAQGKTNAVEAIFLCAFGRSHRTAKDAELIRAGFAGGYVGMDIRAKSGGRTIEIKLKSGERKQIFIDKLMAKRTGELMGALNAVMFSPEDLELVKGAPAERRRFMDMELSQLRPAYYYTLQRYNAALKQRNALLKPDAKADMNAVRQQLYIWDEQLSQAGAEIMRMRAEFVQRLGLIASRLHRRISGEREALLVRYAPDVDIERMGGGDAEAALSEALYNLLTNAWEANVDAGHGDRPIRLLSSRERLYVVLEVRDEGCGMTKAEQKKIFEPFYSSKNSNTSWGMGLYHVRTIVRAHVGSLRVESKPGRGTSFFVLLPKYVQDR